MGKQEGTQMSNLRTKKVIQYVLPTMLSNVCFFYLRW